MSRWKHREIQECNQYLLNLTPKKKNKNILDGAKIYTKQQKRQVVGMYRTEMVCDGTVYPFPVWYVKSMVLVL